MDPDTDRVPPDATDAVTVRYWAGARAAAGTDTDLVPVDGEVTLAWVLDRIHELHREKAGFAARIGVCSAIVGDRPVAGHDPETVRVRPGEIVELLPPFAGG